MITPRIKMETQSFTYVSRNTGKEVFDEIHQLLGTIKEDEVYMEI